MVSEQGRSHIPEVRRETLRMSQLSEFGTTVAVAKMRTTNPALYAHIGGINPDAPELLAPIYNVTLLEYTLQERRIPKITSETVDELKKTRAARSYYCEGIPDFINENSQPLLLATLRNYLTTLKQADPALEEIARRAIGDMYVLFHEQAVKDEAQQSTP